MALLDESSAEAPTASAVIRRRLLAQIGHRWQPGDRLPPIAKLAAQLKAGQRNTHRAVRSLVGEGVLATRPGSGTYVLDRDDPFGARDRTGSSSSIGERPLAGKMVALLRDRSAEEGLIDALQAATSAQLTKLGARVCPDTVACLDDAYDLRAVAGDGAVLLNPRPVAHLGRRSGQVLVVASTRRHHPSQAEAGYDVVAADEQQGAQLAGEALREAGCRSVCFLGVGLRPDWLEYGPTSLLRRVHMEQGWGGALPDSHCLKTTSYSETAGARAVPWFLALKPRPDAVFAACDELAIGFRLGMLAAGYEAGRDYRLIGFDGLAAAQRGQVEGALTTIAIPAEELGRLAARTLAERCAHPDRPARRTYVGCHLSRGVTL